MLRPVPTAERSGAGPRTDLRPASTVMLLRDSVSGVQVFVLRRVMGMAFAPGMTVFPGGAVDAADHQRPIGWVGPDDAWWAAHLGTGADDAHALVVAAVRELFEETGVLLATVPSAAGDPGDDSAIGLTEADRLSVLERRITMADAVRAAGLRLRSDLLRPWANWITPPGQSRRYDTFFFAAALPEGQRARQLTSEADLAEWRTPRDVLAEHGAGVMQLMPPTLAMLTDLTGFGTVAEVMAAERAVTPIVGVLPAARNLTRADQTVPDETVPDPTVNEKDSP